MIFSIHGHIGLIISGHKTQTRRPSDKYIVGNLYAIQPGRGKPGIPEGKILILAKRQENNKLMIMPDEARDEGGYTPERYETLYNEMYPGWVERWAYLFRYWSKEEREKWERRLNEMD